MAPHPSLVPLGCTALVLKNFHLRTFYTVLKIIEQPRELYAPYKNYICNLYVQ